jgi:hypothetical protein
MVRKLVSIVNIVCVLTLGTTVYLDHNNLDSAQDKLKANGKNSIAEDAPEKYNHFAALENESNEAAALSEFDMNISFTGEMGRGFGSSLTHCKALVYKTLKSLPEDHVSELKHLTFRMADSGNRGLGGSHAIVIRCGGVSDNELAAVMIHEMGHVTDIGMVSGSFLSGKSEFVDGTVPIYKDDKSLEFYRISWKDSENLKDNAEKKDFVTGYAATDPFEDFAESYIMYVLHGAKFRTMTRWNEKLRQKYDYLRVNIFDNKEFNGLMGNVSPYQRRYDSTLIPYELDQLVTM